MRLERMSISEIGDAVFGISFNIALIKERKKY